MLMDRSLTGSWGSVLAGTILLVGLWSVADRTQLVSWWVLLLFTNLFRVTIALIHLRKPEGNFARRRKLMLAAIALNGLMIGATGVLFFPSASAEAMMLVPFVIGGLAACAMSAYWMDLTALRTAIGTVLVPVSIKLFLLGQHMHVTMGFTVLVYALLLHRFGRDAYLSITRNLTLELENSSIVEEIKAKNEELKRSYDKLIETQASLVQTSKMAAVGTMASGIAHEINNPLTVIVGMTHEILRVQQKSGAEPSQIEKSEKILKMTTRISQIVKGLKNLARKADQDYPEEWLVRELIDDALGICRSQLESEGIELRLAIAEASIMCRPSQISQVVLNLINNAHDAVDPLQEKWIEVSAVERQGIVEISVTDSGKGIAPDIADKLMNPFFTTKAPGRGTGLGLSISSSIVQAHGGELKLDTCARNTRFVITLPSAKSKLSAA